MSPWTDFTQENVSCVPEGILGVYQLARDGSSIAYVGRADEDLRHRLQEKLGKGYTHFQWVQVPWTKEAFEMNCRLFHYAGGQKELDNEDHPYPPEGKQWTCTVSTHTPSMCEI